MNVSANVIPLIPAGKLRCFVTGVFRPDKPEEHVRQRWARSLVDEYKYDKADIAVEYPIKIGSSTKKVDLAIFKPGYSQKQENIIIIIEAKRVDVLARDKDEGIKQLKSYMAACYSCKHGLWVGAEKLAYEKTAEDIEETVDIPSFGDMEPRVPTYADLVPAVDLKATLRRCHNYIYVNDGIQKAEAFQEMLKLIFAKVYDEKESSGTMRFFIRNEERKSESGKNRLKDERIDPLFNAVKEQYKYIFKQNEEITLNKRVLAYVVSELQKYSLLRTQADVKGSAYEELVGANLRGDRGEYFTPRNVCDMAMRMVLATYPAHKLTSLKIIDTCCGTGGFLVSAVNYIRGVLHEREIVKGGTEQEINSRVSERIKEIAAQNLFGLDINPFLVRTAQMNLVMHGDGSANVFVL